MQRVDFVIAGVAVVALVGSVIGWSMYDQPEQRRYDFSVNEIEEEGVSVWDTSLTGPDAEDSDTWDLTASNVTHVDFTVTISSDVTIRTENTVVRIEITAPNNQTLERELTLSQQQGSGQEQDTIEFHFANAPESINSTLAPSRQAALDAALEEAPIDRNATGTWAFSAEITSGGGTSDPVLQIGLEEVSLEVSADYRFYEASANLRFPDSSVG